MLSPGQYFRKLDPCLQVGAVVGVDRMVPDHLHEQLAAGPGDADVLVALARLGRIGGQVALGHAAELRLRRGVAPVEVVAGRIVVAILERVLPGLMISLRPSGGRRRQGWNKCLNECSGSL
ncbi:hypothetical protein BSQ44_01505 [Aquibium oceanicum]|uniref:Uncharacterized protein n=1 Tax=Aquibium oceanicum TaxID=1670800 RepID=A0A1L3SLL8_9HYPH|nr:hypothetical protein BSQ44_01505 [Aquibium oceanicum]